MLLLNFYGNNQEKLYQNFNTEEFSIKKFQEVSLLKTTNNFVDITDALNMIQVQISAIPMIERQKLESSLSSVSARFTAPNQGATNAKLTPATLGPYGGERKINCRKSSMNIGDSRVHYLAENDENNEGLMNSYQNNNLNLKQFNQDKVADFSSYRSNHNINASNLKSTPDFKNYAFTLKEFQQKII